MPGSIAISSPKRPATATGSVAWRAFVTNPLWIALTAPRPLGH
jgi:hypothetical protein